MKTIELTQGYSTSVPDAKYVRVIAAGPIPLTPQSVYDAAEPMIHMTQQKLDEIVVKSMGRASKEVRFELREAQKKIAALEAVINAEPDKEVTQKLIAALAKIAENEVTLTTTRASLVRIIADIS
jgi:hypothetical protein